MTTSSANVTAAISKVDLTPAARWALVTLSLSMLMPSLDTSIANAYLPTLALTFTAPFPQVQWIVLAYLLAITTVIVSVGRLGDIVGCRRLLLAGIGLFTLASLLCGVAPALWLLIVARTAQGLGAAIMLALTVAFVGSAVPKAKTGSAMGLLGTMSAIGTMVGPALGGLLITGLGWRSIFLVNVPLGIVNWFLARRYLPVDRPLSCSEHHHPTEARFDKMGTVLLALTLAAFALAMTIGLGHFGALNILLLLAAITGLILFVRAEGRAASPLIQLKIICHPVLSASLAMSVLVSTVMMSTWIVGPVYLARSLGLETAIVGLALSSGPLVAALSGVPAGRIVDYLGGQAMIIAGLGVMVAGALGLSIMPRSFGVTGYVGAVGIITAGYALFQAANNTVIMTGAGPDQRGVISGMLSLARFLVLMIGASSMGALFAFTSATGDVTTAAPEAVAFGMKMTFAVAALLSVFAIGIAATSRAIVTLRA